MNGMFKSYLKRILAKKVSGISYSKEGEDLQILKLLQNKFDGYYVDIGCWHPVKSSNTYLFYLKKFQGVCIDPNPIVKDLFHKIRPKDIFYNAGIGECRSELNYYVLKDSSMNTFNYDFIIKHGLENQIIKELKIPVLPLFDVLNNSKIPHQKIDFFDIDTEGYEIPVLRSNDWEKFRPKILLIEFDEPIEIIPKTDLYKFIVDKDYEFVAKTVQNAHYGNCIFIRKDII